MHGYIPAYFKCITFQCERWLVCESGLQLLEATYDNILSEAYAQQQWIPLLLPQGAVSWSTTGTIMLYLHDGQVKHIAIF